MYISSGLVGLVLRLKIPDVSPASVTVTIEDPVSESGETSVIFNLRKRPNSPEDIIYTHLV